MLKPIANNWNWKKYKLHRKFQENRKLTSTFNWILRKSTKTNLIPVFILFFRRTRWCRELVQLRQSLKQLATCCCKDNNSVEWPLWKPSRSVWSPSRISRKLPSPWKWCQPPSMLVLNATWNKPDPMALAAHNSTKRPRSLLQNQTTNFCMSPSHLIEVSGEFWMGFTDPPVDFRLNPFILGLCGAVHTGVARVIRGDLAKDENIKVICVGDKSRAILQRLYGKNILFVANEVSCNQVSNQISCKTLRISSKFLLGRSLATNFLRCCQIGQRNH